MACISRTMDRPERRESVCLYNPSSLSRLLTFLPPLFTLLLCIDPSHSPLFCPSNHARTHAKLVLKSMDEYGRGFLDGVLSIILFLFAMAAIGDIGQCILGKIVARGNPQGGAGGGQA